MTNHKNILLVDDDADDQLIFIEALKEITDDIDCATANNGLEALRHLEATRPIPSIIFLDLNMPLMNGFECLERIKKEDLFKSIPVVIISTSDSPKDKRKTAQMGADMFLTKASDFAFLKNKLTDILNRDFSKI